MKKPFFERNSMYMALGAFLFFSVGAILTTLVPPLVDPSLHTTDHAVMDFTEQELRGAKLYQSYGCVYCHTQQVRTIKSDRLRYGWRLVDAPSSESWEFVKESQQYIGTKRTGPDLARVGGKYSSEWHWAHMKDPRNMGEKFKNITNQFQSASVMPSFDYLTDEEIKDITAYLQTRGRNMNWRKDASGKELNDYEK